MLSMYGMMLSFMHRMSGVVWQLDFLFIRVDDDLKNAPSEVADYYGLDLSLVTRAFYKQMVNTRIPLTFAPEEPNSESLAAIREGDAFLASGDEARFDNGASLVAAAMR